MRGKVHHRRMTSWGGRITPAHAGKSESGKPSTANHTGSPPRMRGKVQIKPECPDPCRITPAHAGKRPAGGHHRAAPRDHPRACGEKVDEIPRFHVIQGSPPRMRGKAPQVLDFLPCQRITPAHAGKSSYPRKILGYKRDHPRACGEKKGKKHRDEVLVGSPPRMRGKDRLLLMLNDSPGITPAHAGKSAK